MTDDRTIRRLEIYPPAKLLDRIDRWRGRHLPILSRPKAVQRLIEERLDELEKDELPDSSR